MYTVTATIGRLVEFVFSEPESRPLAAYQELVELDRQAWLACEAAGIPLTRPPSYSAPTMKDARGMTHLRWDCAGHSGAPVFHRPTGEVIFFRDAVWKAHLEGVADVAASKPTAMPDSPDNILTTCEFRRAAVAESARAGGRGVQIDSPDKGIAFLRGEHGHDAYVLPILELLWNRALALNLRNVPAFPGEPQNAPAAFEGLDALKDWCRRQSTTAPADTACKPSEHRPEPTELNFEPGAFSYRGHRQPLSGKPLAVLRAAAERKDKTVTAEQLRATVWVETSPGNDAIKSAVSDARKALRKARLPCRQTGDAARLARPMARQGRGNGPR